MKRAFTTNREIHRVCLPTTCEPKQHLTISQEQRPSKLSPQNNRGFEELLLEAVDEELTSLGEPVRKAVYHYLKKTSNINKHDIPRKIDEFSEAIEEIFGTSAKFLEIKIMKRLYQKVGHTIEYFSDRDDLLFIEYVDAAKLSNHTR